MAQVHKQLLRASLVFVWLATAVVSALEYKGQSLELLHRAGIEDPSIANTLIWTGVAADAILGLALWKYPGRTTCLAALTVMLLMTGVATVLDPTLWLHPLGPLTKNMPIAVVLWVLSRDRA